MTICDLCRRLTPLSRFTVGLLISGLALSTFQQGLSADTPERAQIAFEKISISDLKRHCATLASDALEGREAGASGGRAAAAYLQTELGKVDGLVGGGQPGWVQEFGSGYRNILAILPGSDPELRHETIIVGAHYDHVGRGNQFNSRGPFGQIHNGADDNASGAAALLELAKAFASLHPAPRRTLLFAFWDAEEKGLLGSSHWTTNPTRPLKNLRLAVNIDMLGRLRDGKLIVVGWRTAAGLRSRATRNNPTNIFEYQFEPRINADSDFYNFYRIGIPCLHFDSGKHDDYHRPTDDADKLNYPGIRSIAELVFKLVFEATEEDHLPLFRRESQSELEPAWLTNRKTAPSNPRLGVQFDPVQFQKDRAVVTGVTPDSAAFRSGIRIGDRLIKLAHWHSGTMEDLKTIVQIARNPVTVEIERPGISEPVILQVQLSGDAVRVGLSWEFDNAIPSCAIVTQVTEDSPAARAGLKPGDILTNVDGDPIENDRILRDKLLQTPSPIPCRIDRHGKTLDFRIRLFEPTQN